MLRSLALFAIVSLGLSACSTPEPRFGPDGKPLPQVYQISARDTAKIQFRMLDSINTLRSARGAVPLRLSSELNAAAATHSRDMSIQNRPWHFGSDGSSPLDRVRRVGYTGRLLGENISETYESELETLSAWMSQPDTREVILDARGRDMGFAWFQESNGKIWWTLIVGQPSAQGSFVN
ncbi:CAP domain-containing protein [Silicimonas sp. MF1-12-2]|uniref:CAP domain-containing protein n=1 Tax=Silicimonas sp. MF1-12-2 TaxID=3384793 RepID=UPI0039B5E790